MFFNEGISFLESELLVSETENQMFLTVDKRIDANLKIVDEKENNEGFVEVTFIADPEFTGI